MNPQSQPLISIIHFNDVYDIQPKGDLGGIVNFKAKLQALR
jgi:5'-nucleotidase